MDACSGPVLYHGNWLSGKEKGGVYTSPMQTPQAPQDASCVQSDLKLKKRELKIC